MNNNINQQRLANEFNVEDVVFQFVRITEPDLKLRALLALSLFAYNNLENQCILKQTNTILYSSFRPFIDSPNLSHAAMASFQVEIFYSIISFVISYFFRLWFLHVLLLILMMNK